jgi:chitin synthase
MRAAWGTKGSTSIKDLGGAKKTKGEGGKDLVEVNIPTAPDDINQLWLEMKKEINTPVTVKHEKRSLDGEASSLFVRCRQCGN